MKRILLTIILGVSVLLVYSQRCCMQQEKKDTIVFFIGTLKTTEIEYFNIKESKIKDVNVSTEYEDDDIFSDNKKEIIKLTLKQKYFCQLTFGNILKSEILKSENLFYVNDSLSSKDLFSELYLKDFSNIKFIKSGSGVTEIRLTKKVNNP